MIKRIPLTFFLLFLTLQSTGDLRLIPAAYLTKETDLFDEAVACIKTHEGWHTAKHYPYIGYGHRLNKRESNKRTISKPLAEKLLRADLLQKCAVFRKYGKDSLILGVLAYNVGEYTLLGRGKKPTSKLIKMLNSGKRNIKKAYISYSRYNNKHVVSIKLRREHEFDLLFNKTNKVRIRIKNKTNGY